MLVLSSLTSKAMGPHSSKSGSIGWLANLEHVIVHEIAYCVVENIWPPRFISVGERKFECRTGQVRIENVRIGNIDDGWFWRSLEKFGGVVHEPLVELVITGDELANALAAIRDVLTA